MTKTTTPRSEASGCNAIRRKVGIKLMEALLKNGNADLLVEPQYVVTKKRSLFGSKVLSITVSGRPAKYKNFRSLPDGVWTNEVFRDKSKQK